MKRPLQLVDSPIRHPFSMWTLSTWWLYNRQPWSSFKYLLRRNFVDHLANLLMDEGIASKESHNIAFEPLFNARLKRILSKCFNILLMYAGRVGIFEDYLVPWCVAQADIVRFTSILLE